MQFVDHLQSFIDSGNTHIHVDGGNRSDTLIDWYDIRLLLNMAIILSVKVMTLNVLLAKTNYYGYEKLMNYGEFANSERIDKSICILNTLI